MNRRCLICYQEGLKEGKRYHPKCSKLIFGSEDPPELNYRLSEMKELAKQIVMSQQIVTGVQPKISLGIEKTKRKKGRLTIMNGEYILKPPNERFNEMPEAEDLTMHLAQICSIETVPHALIPLTSGELAYITNRIDRKNGQKIHMEDFCQLSELLTENKYNSSMERVGKLIDHYSDFPGLDKVNLFELTLFNFVTGNNDMHLKNFSLIHDTRGWRLSQAYDLLNVNIIYPIDTEESALTINGKKRRLSRNDFESLASSFGLNPAQVKNAFEKIISREMDMLNFIEISFLSSELKMVYQNLLKERMDRLK